MEGEGKMEACTQSNTEPTSKHRVYHRSGHKTCFWGILGIHRYILVIK